MRKVLVLVAALLAAIAVPVTSADAAGNATVHLVHGFGSTTGDNSVDLWVNGVYFSTFGYGTITSSLQLPTGTDSTLLVCSATANPPANANACPQAAVTYGPDAAGFTVSVPASPTAPLYQVLVASANNTNPLVARIPRFTPDLSCNAAGTSRFEVANGIVTPNIDTTVDGAVKFANMAPLGVGTSSMTPGSHTLGYRSTGTATDLIPPAARNFVVNVDHIAFTTSFDPDGVIEYGVIYTDEPIPANCTVPTSSTTSTSTIPSTTTTTAVVQAVVVTPRFTG